MHSSWSVMGSVDSYTVEGNMAIRYQDSPDENSLKIIIYDYGKLGVRRRQSLTGPERNIPVLSAVEYVGSSVFQSDVITTNLQAQAFVTKLVFEHGKVRGDFVNLVAAEDALYMEFLVSVLPYVSTLQSRF